MSTPHPGRPDETPVAPACDGNDHESGAVVDEAATSPDGGEFSVSRGPTATDRARDLVSSGTVLARRVMGVTVTEVPVKRRAGLTGRVRELVGVLVAIGFTEARTPERDLTLRSPRVTARVGLMLGICVAICFVTGLLSHWIQHPPSWFYFPSDPPWLYQFSQGLHVITGTVAIPLLLIKLQLVYPKLFARPVIGTPLRALERLSIAVLVSSMIFQLFTGLMNTAQFYPWKFFFTTTHYAMSYVIVAALMIHIAVKLPIIQAAFSSPLESTDAIDNHPATPAASQDAPSEDSDQVTR